MELQPRSVSPDDLLSFFQHNLETAGNIADQNRRYDILLGDVIFDGHPDFFEAAQGGIKGEQQDTLTALSAVDGLYYETVGRDYELAYTDVAELEAQRANLVRAEEERTARIKAVASRAMELSPRAVDAVALLEQRHIATIMCVNQAELQARIVSAQERLAILEELVVVSGEPWPVPRLVSGAHREPDKAPEVMVVDEIPVVPPDQAIGDVARRIINRHGYNSRAAAMATEFFIENAGRVVTPEDMAGSLYMDVADFAGMDESQINQCVRYRVNSLLNKKKTFVGDLLRDEGFVLQYGRRQFIDEASGKHVANWRRIYRAVQWRPELETDGADFVETEKVAPGNTERIIDLRAADRLDELRTAREQKIEGVIMWLKDNNCLPDDKRIEKERLQRRVQALSGAARKSDIFKAVSDALNTVPMGESLTAAGIVYLGIDKSHQEVHDMSEGRKLIGFIEEVLTACASDKLEDKQTA